MCAPCIPSGMTGLYSNDGKYADVLQIGAILIFSYRMFRRLIVMNSGANQKAYRSMAWSVTLLAEHPRRNLRQQELRPSATKHDHRSHVEEESYVSSSSMVSKIAIASVDLVSAIPAKVVHR